MYRPDEPAGIHAFFGPDGTLVSSWGLSLIPDRSPYRAGDWVVHHGYPGAMPWARRCWRGYVLGCMGGTLLRGIRDDGAEWCEHWGHLNPDGAPGAAGIACSGCPHAPKRSRPEQLKQLEQLGLFDAIDLLAVA